jgi:hypothetical protein
MNYHDIETTDSEEAGIDLSVTAKALLADLFATQQQARAASQNEADSCAADWNTAHGAIGSFADEHSTL